MEIAAALLEDWLRDYYFSSDIDIGSSGVEDFSLSELRRHTGIRQADLDEVIFRDSPSCGNEELRRAIANRWGNGKLERVMATTGSSEALFLIMHALLRPGDKVVVIDPSYHALIYLAESIGCQLKIWQLRFDQQFVPDLNELERLIEPDTRMVIVNFPHNPTGATLNAQEQAALIEMVSKVGAYLVWDAAFAELTYEQPPLPDASHQYERAISIGTLSKAYGLPGLRVGWAMAAPDVLDRCVHLRDYISLYLSPLIELIAQKTIEKGDVLVQMRLAQARRNREILAGWVGQQNGLVEWVPPRGGVTAFVRFPLIENVDNFCHQLTREHKVLLVPGSCFKHPQHARLGFGGQTRAVQQGLEQVSNLLKSHCAPSIEKSLGVEFVVHREEAAQSLNLTQ
jgi:capreomycidine synthase